MSHHDHVYVVRDNLDRVLEGLTLRLAGIAVVRETYHPGTQPVDSSLKGKACPGGRLEKQAGDNLPCQEILLTVLLELAGDVQDMEYLLFVEILD